MKTFYNHTQLEEERASEEEKWARENGLKGEVKGRGDRRAFQLDSGFCEGAKIPLGHVYSLFTERMAREGKEYIPFPDKFLHFVKKGLRDFGKDYDADDLNLFSPIFKFEEGPLVRDYMLEQGLSAEGTKEVLDRIYGLGTARIWPAQEGIPEQVLV
ncbi:hypothetical protein HN832_00085 [archaeon]|jgi:hypothetical protein|nr:hypothetical protein [archaeon]MBT4373642.1 hypothetical protein [archaeon]MBT4531696.1 hypothetical protein [archaeon]MBT7001808.1 hypothetical protein [archaeon]MBT7281793.1 hypothetical protein [archaeon]